MPMLSCRLTGVVWALCVGTILAVASARAAPGPEERGGVSEAPLVPIGVAKLRMTKGDLESLFGAALRPVELRSTKSLTDQILELAPPKGVGRPTGDPRAHPRQLRLGRRVPGPDPVRAEYDLHQDRVYRLRWRLAPRFERTIGTPRAASF